MPDRQVPLLFEAAREYSQASQETLFAMKDRHQQWAKLSHRYRPPPPPVPVMMRDLPGIRDLEAKILLNSNRRGELEPHFEDAVDARCREIFGVSGPETEFVWPPQFYDLKEDQQEYWDVLDCYHEHEDQFETPKLDPESRMRRLRELGLDFANDDGQPLRCLSYFTSSASR